MSEVSNPTGVAAPAAAPAVDRGLATPEALAIAGWQDLTANNAAALVKTLPLNTELNKAAYDPKHPHHALALDYKRVMFDLAYPAGGVHEQVVAADNMVDPANVDERVAAATVPPDPSSYANPEIVGHYYRNEILEGELRAAAHGFSLSQHEYGELYKEAVRVARNPRTPEQFEKDRVAVERGIRGLWGESHDRRLARVTRLVESLPTNLRRQLEESDLGNSRFVVQLLDTVAARRGLPL